MAGIIGEICIDAKELKRIADIRKRTYIQKSVEHLKVEEFERKDWYIVHKYKTKTRIRTKKKQDEIFENRVWMLFKNLGLTHMNKDRNLKLELNGYKKQIDVIAKDNDEIFIIECKSSEKQESINARDALEYWVGHRDKIYNAVREEWGRKCGRLNLIVVVSTQEKRNIDEEYAKQHKNDCIFLWSSRELSYIENLIKQLGPTAKYQLYSVLFSDKQQKNLKINRPALRGKMAGQTFYSFLILAKELLKYAYVHHRDLMGIIEASQVYQRILKGKKLKQIENFIDNEDGYFPNSIIVNFSKPVEWNKKETFDNIQIGTLTFPQYYGSAWIIDGQHRLFGAARAKKDVLVPVLAFEEIEQIEQTNLFVEINEKQTAVPKNLLWDLYSDIYLDSKDEKQKKRFYIAEAAKHMREKGPLAGHIDIPSMPATEKTKYTLSSICTTIEKYSPWKILIHPNDESKNPENISRLINAYFEILKELWPEDWGKKCDSVLLSNSGYGVFFMVFQGIVKDLHHRDKYNLLKPLKTNDFKKEIKKYLKPAIEYLKTDKELQKDIIKDSGRGGQAVNAGFLELKIQEFIPGFWTHRIGDKPKTPKSVKLPAVEVVEEKARKAEKFFRDFVLDILKQNYGSNWWKQAIPGNLKNKLDNKWQVTLSRNPYLKSIYNQNEKKFEYLDLGDTVSSVVSSNNWDIFEYSFGIKESLQRRIKDIMVLRNPVTHSRLIDDQDVADGIAGLLWLSKCIDCNEINPYAE